MADLFDYLFWVPAAAAWVWIVLTIIMLWIMRQLYREEGSSHFAFRWMFALLAVVWLYPVFVFFLFPGLLFGAIANVVTLLFTIVVYWQLRRYSKSYAKRLIPQLSWNSLACIYGALSLLQ